MNTPRFVMPEMNDMTHAWATLPAMAYAVDAFERGVLVMDTLRRRGNTYTEHVRAGEREAGRAARSGRVRSRPVDEVDCQRAIRQP